MVTCELVEVGPTDDHAVRMIASGHKSDVGVLEADEAAVVDDHREPATDLSVAFHAGLGTWSSPTGEIGYQSVLAKMRLRFVENDPLARSAFAPAKRRAEFLAQNRCGHRMRAGRACVQRELFCHDLGNHLSERFEYVLVRRAALGRVGHAEISVARVDA